MLDPEGQSSAAVWRYNGLEFKARRKPWNQAFHPRDGSGKFIENGDPVQISGVVGGGRGTVIGARAGLIRVRRTDGRVVEISRGHLRVTPKPAIAGVRPARPAAPATPAKPVAAARAEKPVQPVKYVHPETGEQVAPVRDSQGRWHMVNPKLITRSGRIHVRVYPLDEDGTVGGRSTLVPADDLDLRTVGTFNGQPKADRVDDTTPAAKTFTNEELSKMSPEQLFALFSSGASRSPQVTAQLVAEARSRLTEPPLLALTAEEAEIDRLLARGWTFRNAYAEAFGMDPDDLAAKERAGLIDVDRIAGRTLNPMNRQLYREYVYLEWLSHATDTGVDRQNRTLAGIASVKAAPAPAELSAPARLAALAGALAAQEDLPISACPYRVNGSKAELALAVAFVRAYAHLKPPSKKIVADVIAAARDTSDPAAAR